jgi:hypothetical protein
MKKRTIRIAVNVKDALPLDDLDIEFQGEVKISNEDELEALEREIEDTGYAWPLAVVQQDGKNKVVGGKRRVLALRRMRDKGWQVPPVPVFFVEASNVGEAKRRVLQDIAQYGHLAPKGLADFIRDDFDPNLLAKQIPLIELGDPTEFLAEYFPETTTVRSHERILTDGETEESVYTRKILIPIYEPKSESPPPISEMVETMKADELLREIDASTMPEEVKGFLRLSACRHRVFNYERIAEYYSHAPKDVQDLMEKSALVIIDFQKAIENGFVAMSEELVEVYKGGK